MPLEARAFQGGEVDANHVLQAAQAVGGTGEVVDVRDVARDLRRRSAWRRRRQPGGRREGGAHRRTLDRLSRPTATANTCECLSEEALVQLCCHN
jgi:hypothetical protein